MCFLYVVIQHQSQRGDWVNGTGYLTYGIVCKDQCEYEFRTATDADTTFTLCTPIHGGCAHLPSLFICCADVHTKGPFLLMKYVSLLFLCFFFFFLNFDDCIEPLPPYSYNHHLHTHIQLPPPHSASCLGASEVCAPVGERKMTTSPSCNGGH